MIEATKELRAEKDAQKAERDAEIAALKAENDIEITKLKSENVALESRLDNLEDMFLALSTTLTNDKLAMHTQAGLDEVQKTIQ